MNVPRSAACVRIILFAATISIALVPVAQAQDASPTIAVSGRVQHPGTVSLKDLQALPRAAVSISFETSHGAESATYAGALLWTVVGNAQPIDEPGKNARLRHTLMVTGRDGYEVALSWGELDPDFEGKTVILAYEKDGKPIDDGVRLIVPGDHHGGRAVKDVASIDAR